jgi:hypothetical protein
MFVQVPVVEDKLMYQAREPSKLLDLDLDRQDVVRAVSLVILGVLGLFMLGGMLTFGSVLGYIVAALSIAAIAAVLVRFFSGAMPLALIIIGAFAPFFIIVALLDQTKPVFVPPMMAGTFLVAAGIVAGYWRPDRIRYGLLVVWAVVLIVFLLSFLSFSEPEGDDLTKIGLFLAGVGVPIVLPLLGGLLGRFVATRSQREGPEAISRNSFKTAARIIIPGLAVLLLAFTPVYVLDRTVFRDPVFDVTLLDEGMIELSQTTVRDSVFGIEYRITNDASEPRRLTFRGAQFDTGLGGHGPNEPSRMLQPGESIEAVMAISGGTGPGQIELCNSPGGDCAVLTIE